MTRPSPLPRRTARVNPGLVFLAAYRPHDKELRQLLQDAAEEAERIIPKLIERNSRSGQLNAARLAITLREIHSLMAGMWGDYLPLVRSALRGVAVVAVRYAAEDTIFTWLRQHGGRPADIQALKEGIVHRAQPRVDAVIARTVNDVPLSTAVYRTQKLAQGWVDRKIRTGLLLGKNAKDIAKDVRDLIRPDVRGGVSYAAMRLARTEINNAYHTMTVQRQAEKPWVEEMEWHLSRSHPHRDPCDELVGQYPKTKVPAKPHPQCFCYVTAVPAEEDDWIDNFMAGQYDDYLDESKAALDRVHRKVDRPVSVGHVVKLHNRRGAARRNRGGGR
jgi:hypothetical protein